MSLIKSLNSGVSGLKAFQAKMDTIGNNIANVDTSGFKSSSVSFAEMMNENIGGSNSGGESAPKLNNQVGLGVRVASVERDFSQGAMQSTGKSTDLAIEGEGFFVVNDGKQNLMTRAGNFVFNKNGHLVDQGGRFVQGYNADESGNILGGGTTDNIKIDFENALAPKKTDNVTLAGNLNANTSKSKVIQAQNGFTTSGGNIADATTDLNNLSQTTTNMVNGDTIEMDITLNDGTTKTITHNYSSGDTLGDLVTSLDSQVTDGSGNREGTLSLADGMLMLRSSEMGESQLDITNVAVNGTGSINFPGFQVTQDGATNTQTMSTTVYDDLGRAHSLLLDFTQTNNNEWEYEAQFADGETINSGATGTVTFDELGQLSSGHNFTIDFDPGSGAQATSFQVQFGDSAQGTSFTQYAGSNSAKVVNQDGYTQGELVDVSINGDGRLQGVYDNGQNKDLAQIALGQVQNQNGMEMVGGGLFRATSAAGEVFVDTVDNLSNTGINSGALEGSNVDLAQEFTEMITSQRAYQSNARVISTSDEMLTEAVNLKR
ncbi:flagellar hook protein FlgE [Aliifodinibius sp. S!AR15-10]|uniref:flagellar hook protein FlgE n=1 Tax=Aliifodinibius sp. S!AR15-10 TaxID=2950437 RepID=UPI00285D5CAE|nr:flagellar hook protein FlgE [Aliifodinibius sp. S!AR15-10]MDR8394249.1 flagellar hook protein FlgE [Aliifodinibius sp. S!AR15-10]